jgi:hypothetical protein
MGNVSSALELPSQDLLVVQAPEASAGDRRRSDRNGQIPPALDELDEFLECMHLHALHVSGLHAFAHALAILQLRSRCLQISSALIAAADDGWIAWVNPQWFHQVRDSMISSYRCSQEQKNYIRIHVDNLRQSNSRL